MIIFIIPKMKARRKMKTNEIKKIIKYARTNNIKNIDTAHAYGDSEQRLGNVGIKNFNVIVKLPATNPTQPYDLWVKKSIHSSFKKLKINNLYFILIVGLIHQLPPPVKDPEIDQV